MNACVRTVHTLPQYALPWQRTYGSMRSPGSARTCVCACACRGHWPPGPCKNRWGKRASPHGQRGRACLGPNGHSCGSKPLPGSKKKDSNHRGTNTGHEKTTQARAPSLLTDLDSAFERAEGASEQGGFSAQLHDGSICGLVFLWNCQKVWRAAPAKSKPATTTSAPVPSLLTENPATTC